jgi:hypothetical protein
MELLVGLKLKNLRSFFSVISNLGFKISNFDANVCLSFFQQFDFGLKFEGMSNIL